MLISAQAPVALYLASLLLPSPSIRRLTQSACLAALLVALPANWEWGADAARRQWDQRAPLAEAIRARHPVSEVAAAAAEAGANADAAVVERVILRARDAGVEPWAGLPLEGSPGAATAPEPPVRSPASARLR